jgi:hypothetical protein
MTDLEQRVVALEKRVQFLEAQRPGRRPKPMVAPNKVGICALDPDRPSDACEDASIYRYQQGCRGDLCNKANQDYYAEYRKKKRSTGEVEVDES